MNRKAVMTGVAGLFAITGVARAAGLQLGTQYEHYSNDLGSAVAQTLRFQSDGSSGYRATAYLEHRHWGWNGGSLSGTTGQVAAYYDLDPAIYGSSQIQAADHTYLFPTLSAYQEFGYKFGAARQWALALGAGMLRFQGSGSHGFVSAGPTWWFARGNAGYRYTQYDGAGNENQRVFMAWQLATPWRVRLSADRGKGFYAVCPANTPCATAFVQSQALRAALRYQWTARLAVTTAWKQERVQDRLSGATLYTGNALTLSLGARW